MRLVFLGSPEFALPTLEALIESPHDLVAVITQPDRPAGRGHSPKPPPVKLRALEAGLNVLQPENVSSPESVETLTALEPDVFVVAAYGQILRQRLLAVPKRGSLNVHASLLPRHRGASPIAAAILAGDDVAGVTVMEVVRALDAGPMVSRVEVPISPFDTTGSLEQRIAVAGASLLAETLDGWYEGRIPAQAQDEALVTYAPQISRTDARIDWSLPAVDLWRRVRAFSPWPIAYTTWRGEDLRILEAWPLTEQASAPPGTILGPRSLPPEAQPTEDALAVQTGDGLLALRRVQRPGRNPVSALEFLRGQRDLVSSRFE